MILAPPPILDDTHGMSLSGFHGPLQDQDVLTSLPVPGSRHLAPQEFSSLTYLKQKVLLLEAQLGQQQLNLAALQAQGAAPKLINEVQWAISGTSERLAMWRTRAERKATG